MSRATAEIYTFDIHRVLRDLPRRRGLRPVGLHVGSVLRVAGLPSEVVEQAVLTAMIQDATLCWTSRP